MGGVIRFRRRAGGEGLPDPHPRRDGQHTLQISGGDEGGAEAGLEPRADGRRPMLFSTRDPDPRRDMGTWTHTTHTLGQEVLNLFIYVIILSHTLL